MTIKEDKLKAIEYMLNEVQDKNELLYHRLAELASLGKSICNSVLKWSDLWGSKLKPIDNIPYKEFITLLEGYEQKEEGEIKIDYKMMIKYTVYYKPPTESKFDKTIHGKFIGYLENVRTGGIHSFVNDDGEILHVHYNDIVQMRRSK